MNKKILPWIITLAAFSVSGSAAFYSVYGLGKMFAGASLQVMILASSLEFSKLVTASLLYQYWDKLNRSLRTYLSIATLILILITSAGIYGFLSSAYQETANKSGIVDQKVKSLEQKKSLYEKSRDSYIREKESILQSSEKLRDGLSKGSTTQYTDKKGNVVISSNNANRRTFERQLESTNKSDSVVSVKLSSANDSIFAIENQILNIKTNSGVSDELGPLRYISNLTGKSLDTVVNWYIIILMIVFDPLAIALVVASNFAFEQVKKDKEEEDKKVKDIINSQITDSVTQALEPTEEILEKNEEIEDPDEYKIMEKKIWKKANELREEGKLPIHDELDTENGPSALSNSSYRNEEDVEAGPHIKVVTETNKEPEENSDKYNKDQGEDYGGYKIKKKSAPDPENPLRLS